MQSSNFLRRGFFKAYACSDLDGRDKQCLVQEILRARPQRKAGPQLDGDMTLGNGQARGAVLRPLESMIGPCGLAAPAARPGELDSESARDTPA